MAPLSGAQAKQTWACTKASRKPQPTSQFPWFFLSLNTYKHIYIQTKAEGNFTCHRIFQERERFYHFWCTSFPQLLPEKRPACLPARLPACLPACLPVCVAVPVRVSCTGGEQTETEAIRQAAVQLPWVHSLDLLLPVLLPRRGCRDACERGPFIC